MPADDIVRSVTLNQTSSGVSDLLDTYVDLSKFDPGLKRPKKNSYENIELFKAFTNSN